jgi:putative nucleotidyltransferase with HDIG domain
MEPQPTVRVKNLITKYNPKGDLAHTARFFLALAEVNHKSTKEHVEKVALLCEETARVLGKDAKAAFFAGLLHDIGKILLPATLFDGHNISEEEYTHVKEHAQIGFKVLKKFYAFTALSAGLHHNLYKTGYGISVDAFPSEWSLVTIRKILDISAIVSICDFVDAFMTRKTVIKDGSDNVQGIPDMRKMLYNKYPDDRHIVDTVIDIANKKPTRRTMGANCR